jgi:hypothetical protein
MKNFGKLAFPHLIGLLIYAIICRILDIIDRRLGGLAWLAIVIILHTVICFIISIYQFRNHKKEAGKNYLLMSLLILLIGFGTCMGLNTFH